MVGQRHHRNTARVVGDTSAVAQVVINGNRGDDNITLPVWLRQRHPFRWQGNDTINANATLQADGVTAIATTGTGVTISGDLGATSSLVPRVSTPSVVVLVLTPSMVVQALTSSLVALVLTPSPSTRYRGLMAAGTSTGFITISDFAATAAGTTDTLN